MIEQSNNFKYCCFFFYYNRIIPLVNTDFDFDVTEFISLYTLSLSLYFFLIIRDLADVYYLSTYVFVCVYISERFNQLLNLIVFKMIVRILN